MSNPRMMITFTEPQHAFLATEAKRLGISIADAVRRIIDRDRARNPTIPIENIPEGTVKYAIVGAMVAPGRTNK